jgi:hypothetical protein
MYAAPSAALLSRYDMHQQPLPPGFFTPMMS